MPDIGGLRKALDREDRLIAACLARRFRLAIRIAQAKLAIGMPLRDPEREAEVLQRVADGVNHENPQFVEDVLCVYRAILERSVETQRKIFEEENHE